MPGTSIGVLLDTFLDEADNEMLVRMTYESVLHVMRMHNFCAMWRLDTINANPLRSGRHRGSIIQRCLRENLCPLTLRCLLLIKYIVQRYTLEKESGCHCN